MNEKLLSKNQAAFGLLVAAGFAAHFTGLVHFPWWIDWAAGLWFYTIWGFFALVSAEAMLKRNEGVWWVTWLAPLLVLFVPADAAFNVTYGSAIFREKPRWDIKEFMFSSRVERHYRNRHGGGSSTPRQVSAGVVWAERLNAVAKDHIHD